MREPKYYLVHKVYNVTSDKIMKILKDGYLYASSETKISGLYPGGLLDYVYFSLFGSVKDIHVMAGVNFILDIKILYDQPFRYAYSWTGNDMNKNIEANPKNDNIDDILYELDKHIKTSIEQDPYEIGNHEILIKEKVDLNKYLVAICCSKKISSNAKKYIKKYYPNVKIIDQIPNSATELSNILTNKIGGSNNLYYYKYIKYKTKYLNLID
jgi:hypothetical protein